MNAQAEIAATVDAVWNESILPALHDYIRIPNVSPEYDADWEANGFMEQAVDLIVDWCSARPIAGIAIEVQRIEGRTPLVVVEVPATDPALADRTVVLYGHLDKQPEMIGWRADGGPWTPLLDGDRLYGRGAADDGYAAFAALTAIEAAQLAGMAHSRLLLLVEASEESGSVDLEAHLDVLGDRLGVPELVICLDSATMDTDHLWITTSLRGLAGATLTVSVLTEGVHSGAVSGVVPSSFRIIRELLDRVEESATGAVLLDALHVEIPDDRLAEAADTAAALGDLANGPLTGEFTFAGSTRPMVNDPVEQLLNRTWRPTLSYVGADGLPPTSRAGNVLRPSTSLALSFRLPPTCDADAALAAITDALTADPPSGADVTITNTAAAPGWNSPPLSAWLRVALDEASNVTFGAPASTFGEGGTIPFMGMLGERYPDAQFMITGVLVPGSNAHGPNEFLHLPTARRVTAAVAHVLAAHAASPSPISALA